MQQPTFLNLKYTYKKPGTEVWVLNTDDIPLDKALIKDNQIVHIPPKNAGGNHKHPRIEWYIGIGDLLFVWLDEKGEKHEHLMNPNGQIILITVPPFVPHAVANISETVNAVLFEYADGKMKDVEPIKVY
ncbi:MAG: hypothetical protein AAB893_03165 [Patescibacteria group bacterium]